MRFRQLELIRYGGFADRLLDFGERGEGAGDLHLIVGPNEAGKSTTLHAIGDFLFGIAGQTAQGWRWGYGDLRIRGLIEADGQRIEAVRRKGNKDTLLHPVTGAALAGDVLAPLLAGIDRAAFERMFGLDHQRLRDGGEAILRGRDDAAQITLEAGSGLAGIGQALERFTGMAAELFKPSASKPTVNRLLAERAEALKQVREASISDRDWSEEKARRVAAEEKRAALLAEADALTAEDVRLERVRRARAPLARLGVAKAALAELGEAPDLPADAAAQLAQARGDRRTTAALEAQLQADWDRTTLEIAGITVPSEVLAAEAEIVALEERRPVIDKEVADLPRRVGRREAIDARLAEAREQAGLAADAALPGQAWRQGAAAFLQTRRDAAVAAAEAAKRRAALVRRVEELTADRAALPATVDTVRLEAALAMLPGDAAGERARLAADLVRRESRARDLLAALAPWRGEGAALAAMLLPSPATAVAIAREIDAARDTIQTARREADKQEEERIRADSRIAALSDGEDLPTAEAIAAARSARDALIAGLIAGEGGAADVTGAVARADLLADRRDAQATRLAEHAAAVAARQLAAALYQAAIDRAARGAEDRSRAEAQWQALLAPLGFAEPVAPADWPHWAERRGQALAAAGEAAEARDALAAFTARETEALAAIGAALRAIGVAVPEEPPMLAAAARDQLKRAIETASAQAEIDKALVRAQRDLAAAGQGDGEDAAAAEQVARLATLLREAGLPEDAGEEKLARALAAIEAVAEDLTSRVDVERQITTMQADGQRFAEQTDALLATLGRTRDAQATRIVADLARELRAAQGARDRLAALESESARLTQAREAAAATRLAAERVIAALCAAIDADGEAALDAAVTAADERARLLTVVSAATGELGELARDLATLAAEVAALSPEDEAIARRRVTERRETMAAEREDVGRALAGAEAAFARAAGDSSAAEAQQLVADSGAALGAAAESHVEAAAAAALLRWVLDRHRQVHQAPLIARAGALFATVTAGAFTGLGIDYDEGDRPAIRAIRAGGGSVGVEALSEGTRDQLYLALRLGSIETGAHALPIVCDDLLITADDTRAAAMLRVLAVAARRNQVLLFTHHAHLVEVAHAALGADGFVLHRLEAGGAGGGVMQAYEAVMGVIGIAIAPVWLYIMWLSVRSGATWGWRRGPRRADRPMLFWLSTAAYLGFAISHHKKEAAEATP